MIDMKKLEQLSALTGMQSVDLTDVWAMMQSVSELEVPDIDCASKPLTQFTARTEPQVEREDFTAPRVVRKS